MKSTDISYKWKVFATISLSTFIGVIDWSFVNISLPLMTKTFGTGLSTVMWINLIYYIVLVSLGPVLGKIGEVFGLRKVFIAGSAINIIGLISCSFSQTIVQLILFRIFQAIGNAMIETCSTAIITNVFSKEERGKGFGLRNSAAQLGFIIGPIIGGFLLNWFDWRSIFYVRVPVWILVFFMGIMLVKKDKLKSEKIRFDYMGTITSLIGMFSLILGIALITRLGLKSPVIIILIFAGLLFLSIFVYLERKAEDPIIDLSLFRNKYFSTGILSNLLYWISVLGYGLILPFFYIQGLNLSPSHVGLLVCIGSITSFFGSPISGSLSDRFSAVKISIIGVFIQIAMLFLLFNYNTQTSIIFIIFTGIIGGIAGAAFQTANTSIIMGAIRPEQRGAASAMMASVLGMSLSLGMAWAGTVFSIQKTFHHGELIRRGVEQGLATNQSVSLAFHNTISISICIGILLAISTLLPVIKSKRDNTR